MPLGNARSLSIMSEIRPVMTVFAGTNGRHLRVKGSIPPTPLKLANPPTIVLVGGFLFYDIIT